MTEIWARRTLSGFVPLDASILQRVPLGELVQLVIRRKRNVKRHNLFFKFVQVIFDNLPAPLAEKYTSVESLLAAFKVLAGHAHFFFLPDGREVVVPRSISFAKMDEDAFAQFMDKCFDLAQRLMPNMSDDAKDEIFELIGYKEGRTA